MNLVDSSAWFAYLADEPNAEFFAAAIEDTELLLVPSVCLHEVFKVVLRERGKGEALQTAAAMQQGTVVDLTATLALESALIGHEEKLPFADSVIFATARKWDAVIWTQDDHFAGKPKVEFKAKPKVKR
jgi:toxin FitB